MTEPLTLATLQVEQKDILVLKSLLSLAEAPGRDHWEVAEGGEGYARVVDVDRPEGEALWEDLAQDDGLNVAFSRKRGFPARYLLHKPLRMGELLKVLDELAAAASEQTERDAWRAMMLNRPDNALPLSEHLRRRVWHQAVELSFEGLPSVFIDPGAGVWYSTATDRQLSEMLECSFPADQARPLCTQALVDATANLNQQNLTNLKWRAGLAQSCGELHPDLAGPVEFMLPQIPLQALSDTSYTRQARVLLSGPLSADQLMASSQSELADVAEFLNACYACGFLLVSHACAQRSVAVSN